MRKFITTTLLSIAFFTFFHAHAASNALWNSINGDRTYEIKASGDGVDIPAGISIVSSGESQYGGAVRSVDVSAHQGEIATLAGDLRAEGDLNGVAIWMRIEGDSPLPPAQSFSSSARHVIQAGSATERRQVRLKIPDTARRLLFGVVASGRGKLDATNLSLSFAQPENVALASDCDLYGQADALVRQHALFANRVKASEPGEGRQEVNGVRDAGYDRARIRDLLAALGDRHSKLLTPEQSEQHSRSTYAVSAPQVKTLAPGIVYVKVPGILGRDRESALVLAKGMAAGIARHASQAEKGWVVDLRGNVGGNMWPMLAGLHSLLGPGAVGGFRDRTGKVSPWIIPRAGVENGSAALDHARVAVLVDERTASSGEAVAVAFHGRAGVRLFGRPTAGLSTGNASFPLCDGSLLLLTTSRFVDRKGTVFGKQIVPDLLVEAAADNAGSTVARDADIDAAQTWLSKE
ncbi:hypothetical protein FJU30_09190 [Affinibrenneria salicis]|uniref:Tail specific protease domain-containing protein n=1 Tax=Affinibrenneria salicis TaxID=2590031 RepID=A0A5J5G3G8_9GAMM|nr:S41 family peptidase [Affinibrenneria salicis]KAA9001378.1 hypothetical protein FJU30_09190 [Affinibrenneria salicis]